MNRTAGHFSSPSNMKSDRDGLFLNKVQISCCEETGGVIYSLSPHKVVYSLYLPTPRWKLVGIFFAGGPRALFIAWLSNCKPGFTVRPQGSVFPLL
jgi:hypothetical protein